MPGRDPLLPKWVLTTIAVVVTFGWLATVVAALLTPSSAATLLPVTGVLTMVIGAAFGIRGISLPHAGKRDESPEPNQEDKT